MVFLRGLRRNEFDDRGIDLKLREVDRGNAVLLAEKGGNFLVLHKPHFDEVVAKLPAVGFLCSQRLLELIRRDLLLLKQELANVDLDEVKRLLAERLKARGLAVARMPAGSPGMEGNGVKEPYDVILVLNDGSEKLYARYSRDGSSRVY